MKNNGDIVINDFADEGKVYLILKGSTVTTYDDRWTGCAIGYMQGNSILNKYIVGAHHYGVSPPALTTVWVYKDCVQVFSRDIRSDFADAGWPQAVGISPDGKYMAIFARRDTGNFVLLLYEGS